MTAQMYQLIRYLNDEGITILMISHDIGAAVTYASHILHISDHIFFGTTEEYRNSKTGQFFLSMEGGAVDA